MQAPNQLSTDDSEPQTMRAPAVLGVAIIVVCLGFIAYSQRKSQVRQQCRDELRVSLKRTLDRTTGVVSAWIDARTDFVRRLAAHPKLNQAMTAPLRSDAQLTDQEFQTLKNQVETAIWPDTETDTPGLFAIVNRQNTIVLATRENEITQQIGAEAQEIIARVWEQETVFVPARPNGWLTGGDDRSAAFIWVSTPLRVPDSDEIRGALFVAADAKNFSDLCIQARTGVSGETYAFDRTQYLLTQSRFEDMLREQLNLLSASENSMLNVRLLDPGVNLLAADYPDNVEQLQPILPVRRALFGDEPEGLALEGHRDYRGIPVVGAWTWLEEYNLGLITETDYEEAYRRVATTHVDLLWLYLVGGWIIQISMLFYVTRSKTPTAAMAWLLVVFLQPWAGLAIYAFFGDYRRGRRIEEQLQERARQAQHTAMERAAGELVTPDLDHAVKPLEVLAENLGHMTPMGGNSGDAIVDTVKFIDQLVEDIDGAKHHVHLMFYIFADDATGMRVIDALKRASGRGVECRLLVDELGSWSFIKGLQAALQTAPAIEFHRMLPVSLFRRRLTRVDRRNHRKLAIIDGITAYSGSQNVVDASYGHKDLVWLDMMLRLQGPVVLQLQRVFAEDWYSESEILLDAPEYYPTPEVRGDYVIQPLPSGPTYETGDYHQLVTTALYLARRRVVITSPYLVPDESFMQALESAVLRGVRVDLVVPERSDQVLVGAVSRSYYSDLMALGEKRRRHARSADGEDDLRGRVNLYLYQNALLHTKSMTVDFDLALVGSGNFDIRSFRLNYELNLLGYGPQAAQELREIQFDYIRKSKRLTPEEWSRARSRFREHFDDVCKLLSPLM